MSAIAPLVFTPEAPSQFRTRELFEVSQRLISCGKQKEVTEVRIWLRQFDDEVRIDIAFALLRRLAKKVTSLMVSLTLLSVVDFLTVSDPFEETDNALVVGIWHEVRGRSITCDHLHGL